MFLFSISSNFFKIQAEYQKDAEKMMHHHNLPLDYPEFVRAKESAKNASDVSKSFRLCVG